MKRWSMILVAALLVCAQGALAADDVWDLAATEFAVPSTTKLRNVADELEALSRKLDPSGRGIRIVCQRWPDNMHYDDIGPCKVTNAKTLRDIVRVTGEDLGYCEVRFVADVALFCRRPDMGPVHFRTTPLCGTILDDASGVAVTNGVCLVKALVKGGDTGETNRLTVAQDGTFSTEITYVTRRPYLLGITLYEEQDDTVDLLFTAPTYKERVIRIGLGDGIGTPVRNIAVRLERDKPDSNIERIGVSD